MGELVLVRHGQANSFAKDEASYDRLSDLGRTQARWLGEWFDEQEGFDQVISGTMSRQVGTAQELGHEPAQDPRLNELNYYQLSDEFSRHGNVPPHGPEEFARYSVMLVEAWFAGDIGDSESFESFETRVTAAMEDALNPGARVLCVTSGGVIAMMLRRVLDLSPARMANMMLPIFNSSVHRIIVREHGTYLAGFNAIPHLESDERAHARTHY